MILLDTIRDNIKSRVKFLNIDTNNLNVKLVGLDDTLEFEELGPLLWDYLETDKDVELSIYVMSLLYKVLGFNKESFFYAKDNIESQTDFLDKVELAGLSIGSYNMLVNYYYKAFDLDLFDTNITAYVDYALHHLVNGKKPFGSTFEELVENYENMIGVNKPSKEVEEEVATPSETKVEPKVKEEEEVETVDIKETEEVQNQETSAIQKQLEAMVYLVNRNEKLEKQLNTVDVAISTQINDQENKYTPKEWKELKTKLKRHNTELKALQTEFDVKVDELKFERDVNKNLTETVKSYKEEFKTLKEEKKELKTKIKKLEVESKELATRGMQETKQVEEVKTEDNQDIVKQAKVISDKYKKIVEEKDVIIKDLTSVVSNLRLETDKQKEELSRLKESTVDTKYKEENKKLEKLVETLQGELTESKARTKEVEKKLASSDKESKNLLNKYKLINKTLTELEAENEVLKTATVETVKPDVEAGKDVYTEAEVSTLMNQIKLLTDEIKEVRNDRDETRNEYAQYRKTSEEMITDLTVKLQQAK